MGLHHLHRRKLIPEICELICHGKDFVSCSSQTDCINCFKICLTNPQYPPYYNYPPPPSKNPPFYLDQDQKHQQKISTYLIFTLALLATIFFLVCCRVIYTKFIRSRTTTTTISSTQQRETTHDDFLDEEQGPMMLVDHPIWYIRTQGLHHSIVNSITICKYKKGEGLIEGTECSVCLSEFQDDESLRLLPKCHHAFHLPCIDTWLRSHTNCPMCRAPIVSTNPSIPRIPSLDSIVVDSSSSRMEILENSGGGLENTTTTTSIDSDSELRNNVEEERELEIEEVVTVRPRRSVSLDDILVGIANINLDIATVVSGESSDDSDRVLKVIGNENLATTSNSKGSSSFRSTRYLKGVPSPMKRSSSYNGKYLLSWYSRSQRKPNASVNKMHM